jgi:hypothetical protein
MRYSLLFLVAALPVVAFAQSPDNSTCERAFEIPVSNTNRATFTYVNGSVFASLPPVPSTVCSGTLNRRTGWYKFTAIATTHWVRTEGPETDTRILEVLGGTCGSLTSLQCFDGLFTLQGQPYQALSGLTIGSVYFIRAMNSSLGCDASNGNCVMGLAVVSAAPNDECASAAQLTSLPAAPVVRPMTDMATIGASVSQPACTGPAVDSDDDVWYRFTANATTQHFVYDLLYGVEPVIQWFSGSCGSLTSVACDATKATGLTPGQEYRIRLHSEGTDHTLRLLGDVCESASNDECSGAIPIVVALTGEEPEEVTMTTRTGTSSTVPCDVQASDVWFSFVAPTAGITITSTNNESAAIYSGTCGSLTCHDEDALNTPWNVTGLTPGTSYFLKLGENNTLRESTIRVMAQPANDECSDAIGLDVLPYQSGQGFVHGHTGGAATGAQACLNTQPRDVWYSFTATAAQHYINLEPTIQTSSLFSQVLSGSCGSLTSIICDEDNAAFSPLMVSGLSPGTSYFVRVYSNSNSTTAFRIGITVGMVNDECAGALPLPVLSPEQIAGQRKENTRNAAISNGSCAQNVPDLWYTFTATDDEATFVAAYEGSSVTAYTELFSGTCGNLTSLSCVTNFRNRFTGLTPGATYFVRFAQSTFAFVDYVPHLAQVPNDEITDALVAPFGSSSTGPLHNGSSYGATLSYPQFCSQADPDDDTWYRFTATATSHTVHALQRNTLFTEPVIFGGQMSVEVYDTLSTIADTLEAHMISCGTAPRSLAGLQIGHEYWYRVYTGGSAPYAQAMFSTWVQDQSNDEAVGAVALNHGDAYSHYFTTSGATQSLPGADCSTDDTADDDIWFRFTATNQPARIVAGHGTADLTLELFSGAPGNLTSMACSDNILVLPALTSGQVYYVRLYSWRNATPVEGRLGLFVTPSLTVNDCVDEACLGPVLLANPSIEQGAYCQAGVPNIMDVAGLGIPLAPGWPRLHGGSSDGYSSCMPHNVNGEAPAQIIVVTLNRNLPRSGKGMAGALAMEVEGYREYIQAPLSEPLIPGEPYLVSFNAVLSEGSDVKVNGLGALLSVGPLIEGTYTPFDAEPQVVYYDMVEKGAWTNICGIVVPDAAYDNITVGSFFPDRASYTHEGPISSFSSSYHFYDDVVVARINDPSCITSIGDVPWMRPAGPSSGDDLRVYPNPANELLNIVADPSLFGQRVVIEVFDATGSRVHAEQVSYFNALQALDLPQDWKEGLYLVMVRVEGQAPKAARVMVKR